MAEKISNGPKKFLAVKNAFKQLFKQIMTNFEQMTPATQTGNPQLYIYISAVFPDEKFSSREQKPFEQLEILLN